MLLKYFTRSKLGIAGLDISAASVKLLELGGSGSHPKVEAFATESLPADVIRDKKINKPEVLAETLQALIQKSQTRVKHFALACPDTMIINKIIQVPAHLSEYEIEQQIIFEAEKHIPYSLEELRFDFNIVGPNPTDPESLDILLVACRLDVVDTYLNIFEKLDVKLQILDVESYALERTVQMLFPKSTQEQEEEITAIFDIGAQYTNLVVLCNGQTIYVREELFGGQELVHMFAERYHLPTETALVKLQARDWPDRALEEVIQPFCDTVVLQLRRALQFFYSASAFGNIHRILVGGGVANLHGLVDNLSTQLEVPAFVLNPIEKMKLHARVNKQALEGSASSLALVCGLAMRTFQEY